MRLRSLASGALGGLLGGLAMKAVVHLLDPAAFGLSSETDARTTHMLLQRLSRPPVSQQTAAQAGAAMHYAFAIGAGSVYSVLAGKSAMAAAGRGTLFGTVLWLVGDELAVTLSGLENPKITPLRSHLSAWAAHLVYAFTVDLGIRKFTGTVPGLQKF